MSDDFATSNLGIDRYHAISLAQGCCRSTFEKIGKRKSEFRCLEKKRKSEKLIIFLNVFFQVFLILLIDFVGIIQDGNFLGKF